MRINYLGSILKTAVHGATVLLLGAGLAAAQQQVNLTAAAADATLPDGSPVHMWGYSCGAAVTGGSLAVCAKLNPAATGWSPVVITVPTGQDLTFNLTNGLPSPIPTSLVIVGQLGGGLGDVIQRVTTPSPNHDNQPATWPIAAPPTGAIFTPPQQGPRVQSFATEVTNGNTTALTWKGLRPGTYLIESGTHPSIQGPMGLYGILVVTCSPTDTSGCTAGTAYPSVTYNAEVPLLFSEIDPVQNKAVSDAVGTAGFSESATIGPYLNGPVVTISVTNGGSGYTSAPAVSFVAAAGTGSGAAATAVIDTDPSSSTFGQVTEIDITNAGSYSAAPKITVAPPPTNPPGNTTAMAIAALKLNANGIAHCSGGAAACYPPAVNYTPLYYMINGVAFNKTSAATSLFPAVPGSAATPVTGTVLVRMVNAGLRMHVPSIVGSTTNALAAGGFSLIAEDGNPLPGTPRVQSEVFMAAGKTYDVMIDVPAGSTALPVYDRELSLSGNSISRDAGMLAYIGVNGSGLPTAAAIAPAVAVKDEYDALVTGQKLTVSDPSKGVIANDSNVYGVQLFTVPTNGTVTLNANGTFTYAPNTGSTATSDSFTYCANGGIIPATSTTSATCPANLTAVVTLGESSLASDSVACSAITFNASSARYLATKAPGILAACSDPAKLSLTVDPSSISATSPMVVHAEKNGSFTASLATPCGTPSGCPYNFAFSATNSVGKSSTPVNATVVFPAGSGLTVTVLDPNDKTKKPITDYRWIIEEDRTFFVDPKCAQTPTPTGCAANPVNFGTNFHTSFMPVIASGCTGSSTTDSSCGQGQSVNASPIDPQPASAPADVAFCTAAMLTAGTPCLDPKKRYYISVLPGDAAQPFIAGYAGAPDCTPAGVTAGSCGHGMGGSPIPAACTPAASSTSCTGTFAPVTVLTEPSPYPPATLTVFVFEDDYPLNGEHDAGGGIDVLSPNEPGLGGFQITLQDDAGGTGDATGTPTYDMFNMPLSNSLAGTIDPVSGKDACPVSTQVTDNALNGDGSQKGIVGMIVTCPTYESDGSTLSPLAGQAVVKNLYQGRYGVVANPGADRIARGEEWLQTNTLDGQKAHDSFMRIGEPGYFQEFGPAGYHVTIGFANPKIINDRGRGMCKTACSGEVKGKITTGRMSRTPDERLYGSGTHDSFGFTQCYVSLGDPDGAEFQLTKCDADGNFDFTSVPPGNWKITTFDQWNDGVVDGITTPVAVGTGPVDMGEVAVHQWQANIYTRTFIDNDGNGVSTKNSDGTDAEPGLPFVATNIRFRDGSFSNFNNTDLNGYAGFNEVFPLFNWYVVETDSTRFKNTGTHVVYDSGGPVDGSSPALPGQAPVSCSDPTTRTKLCGSSAIAANYANTYEPNPLPPDLSVPGAVYCDAADCSGMSIASALTTAATLAFPSGPTRSTGRIDPPWVNSYGWQGFSGQNSFLEFGKKPFADKENGGIHGHVVYASTRPFDDPQLLLQLSWEPLVPRVKLNLYREDLAADNLTTTLTLVDHTETSSFDDWAQGFRTVDVGIGSITVTNGGAGYSSTAPPTVTIDGPAGAMGATATAVVNSSGAVTAINLTNEGTGYTSATVTIAPSPTTGGTQATALATVPAGGIGIPNMNCPGQGTPTSTMPDPYFFFALANQPQYLDLYNNGSTAAKALPYQSQFKCYDGMHNWNQLQPAPYDGMYSFPSVTGMDPVTGKPTGSNCTGCITNPDSSDPYRFGQKMLPAGKYVVEVVVPPGYELVKEEDKNILIGDNFIAPVTQQFGGLGSIFILPDQASVSSSYNSKNGQDSTASQGRDPSLPSHEGDTGSIETFWPCVGEVRTVPDFISLFPGSAEVSPFAGANRPLCDRKEVTLNDQTAALAKFYIFTPTHTASHFTGVITDDFTAEFDPYSPQFGEKFAPAYLPVSFKDWAGNEIARVYSDAWGAYNGLNYSTWEVNPPNPTGYGPTMMVGCMNDANLTNAATGQTTTDPLFQSGYSQFCYELPFMPGQTGYFDTPVVPTSAFAGGYNPADCAYPDATPAIASVTGDTIPGSTQKGPWVSAAGNGHVITINALGNQMVDNYFYSGPGSKTGFNQQKAQRHFGFGSPCTSPTAGSTTCNTPTSVKLVSTNAAGVTATTTLTLTGTGWSDTQIQAYIPSTSTMQNCTVTQQTQYGGSAAFCGELVITSGNGRQSIDSVNVTVGGKAPTVLASGQTIQNAIDNAKPGDMIIVPSGTYSEMLLMWKPVRLQGVGAASSIIDANPHPAGKLDPWRRQLVCLFGLTLDGRPSDGSASSYDPTGTYTCPNGMTGASSYLNQYFSVDRLPLEATVGWDATLNGNLAEQLAEPTLMGSYEGAGITVLSKGVWFPDKTQAFASDVFPTGTLLLTDSNSDTIHGCGPNTANAKNPFPGNFLCNPSSIDGLTVKNSSQGGGGILVHGWGHRLQISNNRVMNNQGTLSGGITVGQGEHPDAYLAGGAATTIPGSCITSPLQLLLVPTNMALPYCFDMDVNVHNNAVTQNSSLGDELFSSTPAGAGGVTFCNGSDYYKFNYNWVCGNMSTGDGAGVAHIGFTYDGDIEHNTIMFNQSTNPTIVTNGGGLLVMGAPDQDPPCQALTDVDCVSAPNTITPSDGTGPGLVINANLILGNSADSGSGGGLRLQHINGNEVLNFPNGNSAVAGALWPSISGHGGQPGFQTATPWNAVNVTNNIIANNVAGWDGGGVSLLDALATNLINNSIVSNNSTASSGVLFQTLFAPLASTDQNGPAGNNNCTNGSQSCAQPAGLVSVTNSAILNANLPSSITCPAGHGTGGTGTSGLVNGSCRSYSAPELYNDIFWQNRPLIVGVGQLGGGFVAQQNVVSMYDPTFVTGGTAAPAASQQKTGACDDGNAAYWDIGVRGDSGPGTKKLSPIYSVLTNTSTLAEAVNTPSNPNQLGSNPALKAQYCNGARVPVESGGSGWQVPPGTNESNALPGPLFTLLPAATVDEGNNWINLRWGPLTTNDLDSTGTPVFSFDASLTSQSQAISYIMSTASTYSAAPDLDFYGNARKTNSAVDAGAVEFVVPPNTPLANVTPTSLAFGNVVVGTTSSAQPLTLHSTGTTGLTGINVVVTAPFARPAGAAGGTCGATLAVGATCSINVVFSPTAAGAQTGTATITSNATVTGSPVVLSGTGAVPSRSAMVAPSPLAFGLWPTGVASAAETLTVTNTGTLALTTGTFTFGGGTPQPFSRPTGTAGGTCGATLAVGASCTINVVFNPATAVAFSRTLTIAYPGGGAPAATITGSPVTLTGTGTTTRSPVLITPNSLTITTSSLAACGTNLACQLASATATGTVTLKNNAAAGGAHLTVTNVTFSGGSVLTYFFSAVAGQNNCTGVDLAPQATCTVGVRFTNVSSARGVNRTGTINFTDSGAGSPQSSNLIGFATP